MAVVHEDVHQRARQDEEVWRDTQHVRGVLGNQIEACGSQSHQQRQA